MNMRIWVNTVKQMYDEYVEQYGHPDVLHAHCAKWAGYVAMLISREQHIPYVVTEHMPLWNYEQELGPAPSTAWQVALLRESYEQAARVICVSEEQADDLAKYFGHHFCSKFISNLIDTDFFSYKDRPRTDGEPFRFICPAVFLARKGYDVLLTAFDRMTHKNVELHVVGCGTDSKDFGKLLSTSNAANRVVVHGAQDKTAVRELFWKCNAVALATRGEVQPLVLLEGMSTGLPYVSTTVVPRCERFDDSSRVVPVDDVDAFAKAMDEMVESKVDGSILSQHVKEMAALEVVSHQIESVLMAAVNNQPA
jgi:glycosyltransferase involved in cell wall biosynthesis